MQINDYLTFDAVFYGVNEYLCDTTIPWLTFFNIFLPQFQILILWAACTWYLGFKEFIYKNKPRLLKVPMTTERLNGRRQNKSMITKTKSFNLIALIVFEKKWDNVWWKNN